MLAQARSERHGVSYDQARFFDSLGNDIGLEAFDLLNAVFLFVKDAQRRFVHYNRAFQVLMDLASQTELLGRRDKEISPEYLERYRRDDEDVLAGATLSGIIELVRNSSEGYNQFVTSKFPARDAEGQVTGVVGVTRKMCTRQNRSDSKITGLACVVETLTGSTSPAVLLITSTSTTPSRLASCRPFPPSMS